MIGASEEVVEFSTESRRLQRAQIEDEVFLKLALNLLVTVQEATD